MRAVPESLTRHHLALVLVLVCLNPACSQHPAPVREEQFFAFGTLIDLTLYGVSEDAARQASQALEVTFNRMHQDWHAWQPGTLDHTNRQLARLERFQPDAGILTLLLEARALYQSSDGLFNPAIGKLVALWGFHSDEYPAGPPPDPIAIRALIEQTPSPEDIHIEDGTAVSRNPAVQYDLGAFAKGYALDRGIEGLRARGIHNAIINAGGDLRAIGQHGERPWRIGIRHPRQPGILAAIELSGDESVFTSGDYERFFEHEGARYHHIIDPRTGYPATASVSVTVIHPVAAVADAAATALFVAGPDAWPEVARKMGIRHVMLVDHHGVVHMNPAMQARLEFVTQPAGIRLSEPL